MIDAGLREHMMYINPIHECSDCHSIFRCDILYSEHIDKCMYLNFHRYLHMINKQMDRDEANKIIESVHVSINAFLMKHKHKTIGIYELQNSLAVKYNLRPNVIYILLQIGISEQKQEYYTRIDLIELISRALCIDVNYVNKIYHLYMELYGSS